MTTPSRWETLAQLELTPTEIGNTSEVLHVIVDVVERLLPATGGASIVLYDRATDTYATSVSTVPGQTDALAASRVRTTRGATRTIIEGARSISVPRLEDDPFGANPMLAEFGLASYLGVPIFDPKGEVAGVLYAMDRHEREHSADDIAFLEGVGRRAGNVIHHARTQEAMDRSLAHTQTLLAVATCARTLSPLDEMLAVALRQLTPRLAVHQAWVVPFRHCRGVLDEIVGTDDAATPPALELLSGRVIDVLDTQQLAAALSRYGAGGLFTGELVAGPTPLGLLVAQRVEPFDHAELSVLQGVTDQLAVAIAGALQYRSVQVSNAELDAFASAISHDLRSPLASITGFVDLLQTASPVPIEPPASDWLARAARAAHRMSGMIEGLLTHSRLRSNTLHASRFELAPLVADLLGALAGDIEQRQADVDIGPLPNVVADSNALTMVLQNLLSNALKYHRPDEAPSIRIAAEVDERGWRLHVDDAGPGVPELLRAGIFDIFNRGTAGPDTEGVGIGLATARTLAEAMGGTLEVHDSPLGGARFTFSLPLVGLPLRGPEASAG